MIPARRNGFDGTWAAPAAGLVVWGRGHSAAPHAHHAIQLVMSFEGQLKARQSRRAPWLRAGAVIVRPDAPHEIEFPTATVLSVFLDPESPFGGTMLANAPQSLSAIPPGTVKRWRQLLGAPSAVIESRVRDWVIGEFSGGVTSSIDTRVAKVMSIMRHRRGDLRDASLPRLAAIARLSSSRFAHLFTASVGIPVRRYLLWLRLQRAVSELLAGHGATDAAYIAGFADAAHLSRTFRRMFGCPPREFIRYQAHLRKIAVDDKTHG